MILVQLENSLSAPKSNCKTQSFFGCCLTLLQVPRIPNRVIFCIPENFICVSLLSLSQIESPQDCSINKVLEGANQNSKNQTSLVLCRGKFCLGGNAPPAPLPSYCPELPLPVSDIMVRCRVLGDAPSVSLGRI